MNKIYGDKATIKQAKEAKPGDKTVYINWDAIGELPDQYEVIVSEVKFNLKDDFSDVGNGNFMPSPALHYKIAEAKGISGGDNSIIETIYEDVNINDMNCVEAPLFQKIVVGYRCRKYSTVMEEDGTVGRSSVCTIDYNVWNRVSEWWANEEKSTNGYDLNLAKTAYDKTFWIKKYYDSKAKKEKEIKIYPKYQTKWDRKSCFYAELKFAMQKAETKAHEKTIRELAGLMTGYRSEDLSSGRLIFAKVRRSREILQAESAANLHAISKGINNTEPIELLFDTPKAVDVKPEFATGDIVDKAPEKKIEPVKSQKEIVLDAIEKYKANIEPELLDRTDALLDWIDEEAAPEKTSFWKDVIEHLKKIEESIPETFRIKHGLY